jgi:putative porin
VRSEINPQGEEDMKYRRIVLTAALGLAAAGFIRAQTSEDPVLDLLVRKGLVSQAEADGARAQAKEEAGKNPVTPISVDAPGLQKLQFYGDGRLRFENIDQHNHFAAPALTDRERYRLRFGADYYYSDNFKAGFELESATTNDSANQTFGGMFTKASINVGKIYLQYRPVDWLTAEAGKFSNPWYTTTDMVYSFDLNPEGGAELFSYTIPLGGGEPYSSADPKDAKAARQTSSSDSSLTIGLNAVQYIYVDSNEGTLGVPNNDVWILGEQAPVTWKINHDVTFKVAPGFTFYTGGGNIDYGSNVPTTGSVSGITPTFMAGTANSSNDPVFYSAREADDLAVFSVPGEFDFNVGGIPFRPYWDFELNTEGHKRVQDVYLQSSSFLGGVSTGITPAAASQNQALTDNIAWAAGLQIGATKKKGDWSVLGEFRQIGLGAVDQNINGTDFADSFANQQGFKLSGAYNFTDFFTGTMTFYDSWDYKSHLYQALGGTSASPSATASSTLNLVGEKSEQRVQVDLGWKF